MDSRGNLTTLRVGGPSSTLSRWVSEPCEMGHAGSYVARTYNVPWPGRHDTYQAHEDSIPPTTKPWQFHQVITMFYYLVARRTRLVPRKHFATLLAVVGLYEDQNPIPATVPTFYYSPACHGHTTIFPHSQTRLVGVALILRSSAAFATD